MLIVHAESAGGHGRSATNPQQAMAERAYRENWGQRRFYSEMRNAGFSKDQMSQTAMRVYGIHNPSITKSRLYRKSIGE